MGQLWTAARCSLAELGDELPGSTLQVACIHGDLTNRLCSRAGSGGGAIDVVDIQPIQLRNLSRKLPRHSPARLLAMDSTDLRLPDASYDRALVFFLLHEQPASERTIRELFRVVKLEGKILIVDYAKPRWWNPLRYLWCPLPAVLERGRPPIICPAANPTPTRESFFGGLYQKLVITR